MGVIKETGYVELIGKDEQIAQNKWGASAQIPFQPEGQGIEIHTILLRQGYDKAAGSALSGTGKLALFKGDPAIAAGTAVNALTRTQVDMIIAYIDIAAADWTTMDDAGTDASQLAILHMAANEGVVHIPRLAGTELYAAVLWTLATTFNSGSTDDEDLYVKLVYTSD